MPVLMILSIAYSWRQWNNKGIGHMLLVALLYGGVALLWLCGVPRTIEQPIWTGMRFYHPELAYGLIAGAALGIGWSIIYTALNLRGRRPK